VNSFYSKLLAALIFSILSFNSQAESNQHEKKATVLQLPADIKPLLLEEMQQLQQGMMNLIPAVVSGNWDEITNIAKKMQHSYIMKQKLTSKQMHSLHQSLPPAFIDLDHNFHRSAGMLAHVAEEKKMELVNFYVYKLTESCVQCHSKYAQQRFPALNNVNKSIKHH
jgi:hypothetical protein